MQTGVPDTMRAAVARRYGQADVLEVDEVAVPSPGKGEILVRVDRVLPALPRTGS